MAYSKTIFEDIHLASNMKYYSLKSKLVVNYVCPQSQMIDPLINLISAS